jgi:3-dehydroquinate synthase
MLEFFEVSTSGGKYQVSVGEGLLGAIEQNQRAIFLVDEYLASRLTCDPKLIIAIPALESSKNLDYMSGVIEKMRSLGANRDTHVYAIGGGIIQDIATFVNSIYMRGLSWTYFPSTLLSMADSCIGGKSSINVRGYKNLVGNIYPPTAVFVDMDFCQTLGPKEIIGGLAEAVKICYARGPDVFEKYLELDPLYPLDGEKALR